MAGWGLAPGYEAPSPPTGASTPRSPESHIDPGYPLRPEVPRLSHNQQVGRGPVSCHSCFSSCGQDRKGQRRSQTQAPCCSVPSRARALPLFIFCPLMGKAGFLKRGVSAPPPALAIEATCLSPLGGNFPQCGVGSCFHMVDPYLHRHCAFHLSIP